MDTVSTAVGGALLAKALPAERRGPSAVWCVTFCSAIPDADVFARLFVNDPLSGLTQHRGFTHSFLGVAVMAPLIALIFWRFSKDKNYWRLVGLALLGLVWHMFTDVATSWGTIVYYPFSRERVAWDLIFIIDFIFSAILLVPQLLAWVYRDRATAGRRGGLIWAALVAFTALLVNVVSMFLQVGFNWRVFGLLALLEGAIFLAPAMRNWGFRQDSAAFCRWGTAALATYYAVCALSHFVALRRVERMVSEKKLAAQSMAALPQPLSPFQWSGLVLAPEGVYHGWVDVFDPQPIALHLYPSEQNGYVARARELRDVQTYLWFARFPVARYRQDSGRHVVEYADVRFRGAVGGDVSFAYRVVFGSGGEIISSGFVNP